MDVCALHGRSQCCLASPQFLEYIATYSASEPALVSSGSSTSDSSTATTTTAVDPSSTEATPLQKKSGQRPTSITPTSILIKARKNMDVPNPQPVSRRHSSPTAVSEPLRSPPTSPPPVPTSTPGHSSTTRPMTDSAITPPTARRRTLDFAGDENSARRDSKAVNALPKPTKPIYPRPKITQFAVDSIASDTPSSFTASSPRSRVIATSNHVSKVTVTPQSKSSIPSARSTPSKGVKFQPTKPITSKTIPAIKLPNPTNHVHLSRKTDTIPISFFTKLFSSKSTYKKRQSDISDIRDVFVIDPELVLPKGMFRALDDSFVGLGRKDSFDDEILIGEEHQLHHHGLALKRSRTFSGAGSDFRKKMGNNPPTATTINDKKNLKLEVENGGIDVDVHLVPSLDRSLTTTMTAKRTTIDLRLLPDDNFKSGNHSLIARIHAPEKRAPFHLTARTYVLPPPPPPPPPPLANELTPPSTPKTNSSVLKHHRRAITNPTNHVHPASLSTISLSSPSYNTPLSSHFSSSKSALVLDKSNMEIQIPRSYRGPITIHVASGNLDEHILVSREVRERSVVLREGRFARGWFVGRQEFDDDDGGGGEENEEEEEENEGDDEGGEGDGKGEGCVCGICGGSKGEVEERKVVDISKNGSDASTTPLRIVKRKPIKSFSMQNSEKDSISTSKDSLESPPPPPPPPTTTTTPTTIDNTSPSPPPTTTTPPPNDILTNRPSFLDTDPNLSSNYNTSDFNNVSSGWKLSRNQDLNGRARRVGSLMEGGVPYRSSPLRFSMTSGVSAPNLPVLVEEGRGSLLIRGGEGDSLGVLKGSEGAGGGQKVVRVEELSSLPSSSEEEEEEEDGDNDGAGTASGSVNYESAESGSASVEELSSSTNLGIQQLQPEQELIRCTCTHQPHKRVQQRQGERRSVTTTTTTRRKRKEWIGDRIDIMIGKGRVRIRYDDEVEEGDKVKGRRSGRRGRRSGRWFGR